MSSHHRLDDSMRWRAVGRLEAGQSQAEVARWLQVAPKVVSRLWNQFPTSGTVTRKPGQGRPRATTPAQDRYLALSARRHRQTTATELSRDLAAASGKRISRQTVYRRLAERALYARRPVVCLPLSASHRRARLSWSRTHHSWTHQEWGRVLFTDESRFSTQSDSRRVFIWRERGARYHPSNVREIDQFGGRGILVWGGIMLGSRTPLHVFDEGSVTAQRYRDEVLEPYVRLFRGAAGPDFLFMDDNARPHRAHIVDDFLEEEDIRRMNWPAKSPDLNPIEHVWDGLGRAIARRNLLPRTLQLEEWDLLPQAFLDTLINSMRARCEACIAVHGGHTPY